MAQKRIIRPPEGTQSPAKSKYSELSDIDKNINIGFSSASSAFLNKLLGPPTSKEINDMTHHVDVGPFEVEGLDSATNSLREIMNVVKRDYPDLYTRLSNDGMRVVRSISGSKSSSLHSWGIAIDIRVDGIKDIRFNDKALYGLTLIAPIFHEHGWYWGGAFRDKEKKKGSGVYWSNEDSMHFEVSKEKLLEWAQGGLLGNQAQKAAREIQVLRRGAKGPKVVKAQRALKKHNPATPTHGQFDRMTERAVKEVQQLFSMRKTGEICKKLQRMLGIDLDW
jgi:hypothetical protein